MWGDGQWYPDANGAYFYYDENGKMTYYNEQEYAVENEAVDAFA